MPHVDVAILVALPVEELAIVEAIGNCSVYPWRAMSLHLGGITGQQVVVFPIGGKGNARAAQAAELVIGAWNPALLLLAGIAGGIKVLSAGMLQGDILVPDQVVGYELAKVTSGDTARRYEVYRSSAKLLARARSLRHEDWAGGITMPRPGDPHGRIRPLVHTGPVLTGDKVLADDVTVADLRRDWPEAIGVEMESLGVALAAHQHGVGFFMVKAVSDFADERKDDEWHRYAAAAAARFAVAVLAGTAQAAGSPRSESAGKPRDNDSRDNDQPDPGQAVTQQIGDVYVEGSDGPVVFGVFNEMRGRDL